MLNLNQPLRGTTRPHLTRKPTDSQGRKKDKSIDVVCAKVTALFAPYIRKMPDHEWIHLCDKLHQCLSPYLDSIYRRK